MAEIQLTRIKSVYGEIKGYFDGLPKGASGPWCVPAIVGRNFNSAVSELNQVSGTNYDRFKLIEDELSGGTNCNINFFRSKMSGLISRLEQEYGFGNKTFSSTPAVAIFNNNQNTSTIEINYTIEDLIKNSEGERKEKLQELKDELENDDKNWEKIKIILMWTLNFSKELFVQIIPILLEKKI